MKYESRADLLIAAGESIKMQEKAGIEPRAKLDGQMDLIRALNFNAEDSSYEFPLAVIEGKPVFVGDELYDVYDRKVVAEKSDIVFGLRTDGRWYDVSSYSWNPPKPKTVMVELSYEYVEAHATLKCDTELVNACRKALEVDA